MLKPHPFHCKEQKDEGLPGPRRADPHLEARLAVSRGVVGGSEWGGESAPSWPLSQTALLNAGGFHGNKRARQEPWPLSSSLSLGSRPHCLHPARPQVCVGAGALGGEPGRAAWEAQCSPGWRLGGSGLCAWPLAGTGAPCQVASSRSSLGPTPGSVAGQAGTCCPRGSA